MCCRRILTGWILTDVTYELIWRQREGKRPAPEPRVKPVTPTSISRRGHGSVFFVKDRARGAFWRRMLAINLERGSDAEYHDPKTLVRRDQTPRNPIKPLEISGDGRGSLFFARDRARAAFWRHMLAICV